MTINAILYRATVDRKLMELVPAYLKLQ